MSEQNTVRPRGMAAFVVVWIGQLVSMLGTSMSNFALTIWAYEETGQATALALVAFFYITPLLILSPFAGAIVDRSNRKLMMIVSDAGAGIATIIVLLLFNMGILEVWHLYITSFIAGATQTFQWPAFSAAMTMMIPKEQYGRAHGLNSLAQSGSNVFAPILAAAMLGLVGIGTLLWIDIVTFTFAIGTLLFVIIPQPEQTEEGRQSQGSLLSESLFGFRYIWKRKGLLGLQIVFLVGNFFASIGFVLVAPMILARTMNDELMLGSVQSVGAIGGVVGGLLMSAWGGPKKLVHGVFLGWVFSGLMGMVVYGLGQSWLVWAIASFCGALVIPLVNGSNQAIWQKKVAADLQGRVFSIRRLIAWLVNPLGTLAAGPLADLIMEPAMEPGGALADRFGWLVGTGAGAGMALIIVICGIVAAAAGLGGYLFPVVRDVETLLPDHTQEVPEAVMVA